MNAPNRLQGLADIEAALWHELQRGVADRAHDWHTPVLATVYGNAADARTVVLREVDADSRLLRLYTDARAAKVAQLGAHPLAMLVLWSKPLSWQLRLRVALAAHTDGLAVASRWARLKLLPAAHDYLSPAAPGAPLGAAPLQAAAGRGQFALIEARVLSVDWLELHPHGHRRARFDDEGRHWLAP